MSRLTLILTLIAVLCTGGLFAEGNSGLSFDGYPVSNPSIDVPGLGMGETGGGDALRRNMSLLNPSLAVTTDKVTFSTAVSFGYTSYENNASQTFEDDGLNFPYFSVVVPLGNHVIGFNFNSMLSGNFSYKTPGQWDDGDLDNPEYTETQRIKSSLYQADLLWAWNTGLFNVGLTTNFYYGNRINYFSQEFSETGFMDTSYERADTFKGHGFGLGLSKAWQNFSAGLWYNSAAKLEGDTDFVSIHDQSIIGDAEFELPHRVGAGGAWLLSPHIKLAADINYEAWASTDSYPDAQNAFKAGLGIGWEPAPDLGSWYTRIPLRLGGYYRQLPFKKNGNEISETALTAGISIPLDSTGRYIEVSYKNLLRGEASDNLISDQSQFFSIGISGFDIFKMRQKRIKDRYIPKLDRQAK